MEYKKLKELGICTQCKKRKAEKGKVKCKIYRTERKVYKLCPVCGLLYPIEEIEEKTCYLCNEYKLIKKIKEVLTCK